MSWRTTESITPSSTSGLSRLGIFMHRNIRERPAGSGEGRATRHRRPAMMRGCRRSRAASRPWPDPPSRSSSRSIRPPPRKRRPRAPGARTRARSRRKHLRRRPPRQPRRPSRPPRPRRPSRARRRSSAGASGPHRAASVRRHLPPAHAAQRLRAVPRIERNGISPPERSGRSAPTRRRPPARARRACGRDGPRIRSRCRRCVRRRRRPCRRGPLVTTIPTTRACRSG